MAAIGGGGSGASTGGPSCWSCDVCTFASNQWGTYSCEMCSSPNPNVSQQRAIFEGENKGGNILDAQTSDALTEAAMEGIQAEIRTSQALVAVPTTFDGMLAEFDRNAPFKSKIKDAMKNYKLVRRVRGDGNCFYRAYMFAIFERILGHTKEIERLIKVFERSLERLTAFGFQSVVVDDPAELILDQLRWLRDDKPTAKQVEDRFNDEGTSDYIVMYVRLLTSLHMQTNSEAFRDFLGGKSLAEFVKAEVEPMKADSEMPQVVALSNELGIPVRIEYLDSNPGALIGHNLPPTGEPQVFLLYRPGHYDVLYPVREAPAPTGVPHWTPGVITTPPPAADTRVERKGGDEKKADSKDDSKGGASSSSNSNDALKAAFGI